jgi:DNA modification methylase
MLFQDVVAQIVRVPKKTAISTVGRSRSLQFEEPPSFIEWHNGEVRLSFGDSLNLYNQWDTPTVIVSDGGYGVLGFEGDTTDHLGLPQWYEPHIAEWSKHATPQTTLWFWNSEIGWAAVHPILEKHGWRYINANIWDKGLGHIAGNVNTSKIRRFPVVTEICVQYSFEARISGQPLKEWLLREWKRTGLPVRKANEACGVADAAVRKYLDQGRLWYFPPPEKFEMLATYANKHGKESGKPYYSRDGVRPMTGDEWAKLRYKFYCPHGQTNVWSRAALRNEERVKAPNGKALHLNQKPLDLMKQIIGASSDKGDVVWEPFGGLFSASLAAMKLGRRAFSAEVDSTYFQYGVKRFTEPTSQRQHPSHSNGHGELLL